MSPEFPYQPLAGRNRGIMETHSLWLGADHLLSVRNRRFDELYSRFYFREIQGLVICKKALFTFPAYWVWACLLALIGAGIASARGWPAIGNGCWIALAVLIAAWLGVSLFGSCSAYLQTAVGLYRLPALHRIWNARHALRILEERIEAAQGQLPEDWQPDDRVELAPSAPMITADLPGLPTTRGLIINAAGCVFLLADAFVSWIIRRDITNQGLRTFSWILTLAAMLAVIAVLAYSRREQAFQALRGLFLTALLLVGVANAGTWYAGILLGTVRGMSGSHVVDVFYYINQVAELGIGFLGLVLILRLGGRKS